MWRLRGTGNLDCPTGIGQQGSPTIPSDNVWSGAWPSTLSATARAPYQTWNQVSGSIATTQLYVRSGSTFDPTANYGRLPGISSLLGFPWGSGTGTGLSLVSGTPPAYNPCVTLEPARPAFSAYRLTVEYDTTGNNTTGNGNGEQGRVAGRAMAHIAERERWVMQMATFEALQRDSTIADSIPSLQLFRTLGQGCRYGWLTGVENSLSTGDLTTAHALLAYPIDTLTNTTYDSITNIRMADAPAADYAVDNYLTFYKLYLKYLEDTLSSDDSLQVKAIAAMCPAQDGYVVYKARSLYVALYNDFTEFIDDCVTDSSGSSRYAHTTVSPGQHPIADVAYNAQSYTLHPNPSNGRITLLQSMEDNEPVQAEVLNAAGMTVLKQQLQFIGKKASLQLDGMSSGLYLLTLRDSNGNQYHLKFVIK